MMNWIAKYRVFRALIHTKDGVKYLWQKEQAFRQELYLCLILIPLLMGMNISSLLKLLMVLLLLLLLAIESLNSALEAAVDRISLEIHSQSKIAKDMGSAAVGFIILMNIIVWMYAIYQHFFSHHS